MENKIHDKKEWMSPTLTNFGDVQALTHGDPDPTGKTLGIQDEITGQVNNNISSVTM